MFSVEVRVRACTRASPAPRPLLTPDRESGSEAKRERSGDMAEQLLLFANELRTRAREILVRAAGTDDLEAREMMLVIATDYRNLARRADQRAREAVAA